MDPREAERQEWERAIGLLGRSTRPGRLLEYLGAKHFKEPERVLTEFDIATEVFGRSAKTFDSTEDAVVRVEAHRLRKKLRDIYEKDDRARGLRLSLPAGTYVLKFAVSDEKTAIPAPSSRRVPVWAWAVAAAATIGVAVVVFLTSGRSPDGRTAAPPPTTRGARGAFNVGDARAGDRAAHHVGLQRQRGHRQLRRAMDARSLFRGRWHVVERRRLRSCNQPAFSVRQLANRGIRLRHSGRPGIYEMRLFFVSIISRVRRNSPASTSRCTASPCCARSTSA